MPSVCPQSGSFGLRDQGQISELLHLLFDISSFKCISEEVETLNEYLGSAFIKALLWLQLIRLLRMFLLFSFQSPAALVAAVIVVCLVGMVVFLLYRRYKQSSEWPAHILLCFRLHVKSIFNKTRHSVYTWMDRGLKPVRAQVGDMVRISFYITARVNTASCYSNCSANFI